MDEDHFADGLEFSLFKLHHLELLFAPGDVPIAEDILFLESLRRAQFSSTHEVSRIVYVSGSFVSRDLRIRA